MSRGWQWKRKHEKKVLAPGLEVVLRPFHPRPTGIGACSLTTGRLGVTASLCPGREGHISSSLCPLPMHAGLPEGTDPPHTFLMLP